MGALLIFMFLRFPAILGAGILLPSQTVVPLVTMLPIGLLYSVLAARGMEERDEAARAAQREASKAQSAALAMEVAMLRYRSEVSRFKGVLHNDILGSLQAVVRSIEVNGSSGKSETGDSLHSLVRRIREEALTRLNAEQPMGDDFPSQLDLEKLMVDSLNTWSFVVSVDKSLYRASPEVRMLLYVHLHTMLLNARDHGKATRVSVSLGCEGKFAILEVEDNGSGFDPEALQSGRPPTSAGLREAMEVARASGGQITIDSAPGRGTRVRERIPAFNDAAGS